jgi:hypothetical protein
MFIIARSAVAALVLTSCYAAANHAGLVPNKDVIKQLSYKCEYHSIHNTQYQPAPM